MELLATAAVYVQALCPVREQPAALDLLDPTPLSGKPGQLRRGSPLRAARRAAGPAMLAPARWQESVWWQCAERVEETVPVVNACAGIATAVWAWPHAVDDPIGVRQELRNRAIRARAWAASGDLYA